MVYHGHGARKGGKKGNLSRLDFIYSFLNINLYYCLNKYFIDILTYIKDIFNALIGV